MAVCGDRTTVGLRMNTYVLNQQGTEVGTSVAVVVCTINPSLGSK